MRVKVAGTGPDLVLLHGWGMHAGVWDDIAPELEKRFRVHSVDLPGHGGSVACRPYTLDVITAALAAASPPRVTVCGWSLGGQLAMNWALNRPGQVERLVLVAGTPRFVRDADWDCGIDRAVLDEYVRSIARDWRATLRRFDQLQAHGDAHMRTVSRRLREQSRAHDEPDPAALAAGLQLLQETDLRARLAQIAQPALLLHGACDAVVPLAAGEFLQRNLPRATLEVFAHTAHVPQLAQPQRTARSIVEFCGGT